MAERNPRQQLEQFKRNNRQTQLITLNHRGQIIKAHMYILLCSDNSYYTGSTKHLKLRLGQHKDGTGANHTSKRLPVKLVYCEEFSRIDHAFYREKQIQRWSRKKKEALINGATNQLNKLAECQNESHYKNHNQPLPPRLRSGVEGNTQESKGERIQKSKGERIQESKGERIQKSKGERIQGSRPMTDNR